MASQYRILFLAFTCLLISAAWSEEQEEEDEELTQFKREFESGLRIGIMTKPRHCPRQSKRGDQISVRYNCTTVSQEVLVETSPMTFTIGESSVIDGWNHGLLDMCVGEKRELIVPSKHAYGALPVGDIIPGKAPLVFYVELIDIKNGDVKPNTFLDVDVNGDGLLSFDEVARFLRKEGIPDGPGEESHQEIINEIFKEEDKDNDGFISHGEFQGMKHHEL